VEGLLALGTIILALALFDVLALRFGVDSRYDSTDPRRPVRDIVA
jgi:hypothetical protein